MSKFAKPNVQKMIRAADVADTSPVGKPVRFTLVLDAELTQRIDDARKERRLSRLSWLREAAIAHLKREG